MELCHVMKMLYIPRKQWYASFIHKVDNWREWWRAVNGWKYFCYWKSTPQISFPCQCCLTSCFILPTYHGNIVSIHALPVWLIFNALMALHGIVQWGSETTLAYWLTVTAAHSYSKTVVQWITAWYFMDGIIFDTQICFSWHYFNVLLPTLRCF